MFNLNMFYLGYLEEESEKCAGAKFEEDNKTRDRENEMLLRAKDGEMAAILGKIYEAAGRGTSCPEALQ